MAAQGERGRSCGHRLGVTPQDKLWCEKGSIGMAMGWDGLENASPFPSPLTRKIAQDSNNGWAVTVWTSIACNMAAQGECGCSRGHRLGATPHNKLWCENG